MQITAKADYALRAAIELAAADTGPVKGDQIAEAQRIPIKFLENILLELKHAGLVCTQRGAAGGYWLARPANEVTLADIIRAVEGPLANIRGLSPEDVRYTGVAEPLREVWIALRASMRSVLESVTLADVLSGQLPPQVSDLTGDAEAWTRR